MNENGDYYVDILNSSIPISPEDWYKWKSYYVTIDEDIQGRNVFSAIWVAIISMDTFLKRVSRVSENASTKVYWL